MFVKSWGQKGSGPGQFDTVRSIAVDAQGNVYVADGGQPPHPGVRQQRHVQDANSAISAIRRRSA